MKYSKQTLEALKCGYEYSWIIDKSLTQEDIGLFDKLCDRIREDGHEGGCWDLLKVFDQFAHEYCERVKKGKPNKIMGVVDEGGLEKVLKIATEEGTKLIEVEINGVRTRNEAFGKKAGKK